jgi:O-antigen/teichoic acid export membrane protein
MKKTFFQNLVFLIILNILIKPFWVFGVDRPVQNLVGNDSYGLYLSLFNLSFIFNIVLDLGITNYNSRIIAQQPTLIKKYLTNILLFKFLLIIIYFAITILAAYLLHQTGDGMQLLLLLCISQILSSVILYVRSNISAMHYFKTDSVLSVSDKLFMIIAFLILRYARPIAGDFKIEWFVYAQVLSYIITLVISLVILFLLILRPSISIDMSMIKVIWRESYPLAVLVLLMSLYNKMDVILLKRLLGAEGDLQAGIYAMSYRLMDVSNQFGYLFAALLLPIFARMIAKRKSVEELVQVSFKTIFIFSYLLAICCLFFRVEIMQMLYIDSSDYAATILSIIMFSLIGSSTAYIFGTLLTANRNLKVLNTIALIAVIINVTLNLILIPRLNGIGAAIAALCTNYL